MYDSNREAAIEFVRGAGFVILTLGAFMVLLVFLGNGSNKAQTKFEVVDTYKGCDVVRYTDRSNSWHYLLDCHDTNSK
jgi:hypothetical protein